MKRLTLIVAVLAVVTAACGSGEVGSAGSITTVPGADAPSTTTTTLPTGSTTTTQATLPDAGVTTTTTSPTEGSTGDPGGESGESAPVAGRFVDVYFVKDGEYADTVSRTVSGPDVATNALKALLAGPTAEERDGGLDTSIPADTLLLGLALDGGIATVDLSREYETGGGTFAMVSRLAQVVYTLTGFPTIDSVIFRLDGAPVTVFSGEGILLDHPVTRSDFLGSVPVGPSSSGDGEVWAQGDLPALDGVARSEQRRVVLVSRGDVLNVRRGAGVDQGIIGKLLPGVVVRRTGAERAAGTSTWIEVSTPAGPGWVNEVFLGAVVAPEERAAGEVTELLDDMAGIIAGGGDLSRVASSRGIYVSHNGPPTRFTAADLAGILGDATTYKWPSNALDVNDPDQAAELPSRTFAEAVADRFLSAYKDDDTVVTIDTPIESGNSRPGEHAVPFELSGFHYVGVHDPGDNPEYGGLDWTTWYVSIDYENGSPKVVGLTLDEWSP